MPKHINNNTMHDIGNTNKEHNNTNEEHNNTNEEHNNTNEEHNNTNEEHNNTNEEHIQEKSKITYFDQSKLTTESQQLHKAQHTATILSIVLTSCLSLHIIMFIGSVDCSIVYF